MTKYNLKQFIQYAKDKQFLIFGAGIQGNRVPLFFENWGYRENILGFIDNDATKVGTDIQVDGCLYKVFSLDSAIGLCNDNVVILIASLSYESIYAQIKQVTEKKIDVLALDEIAESELMVSYYDSIIKDDIQPMIPRIIHYAWFGGEMPYHVKKNIENWSALCPDYKFMFWNEDNYDVGKNKYMRQAFLNKKWGFVPDYLRLDVVYEYGGIYLDTDIEMIKRPDELLYQNAFASIDASLTMNLGSGFGAVQKHSLIKEFRDYYDCIDFVNADGKVDKTSCNTHSLNVLKKHKVQINDQLQCIEKMNIYPMIFQGCCQHTRKIRVTDKTFWIHHGDMSWM